MCKSSNWIDKAERAVPDRFCKWQIYFGDRPLDKPGAIECESALLQGHQCICPYTPADIHKGDVSDTGKPKLYVSLCLHPYLTRCQDAEILPEVAEGLMAKLPVISQEAMWVSRPLEKPTEQKQPQLVVTR